MEINPAQLIHGNNKNWAIANKTKGRNAAICAVGSMAIGCAKTFTDKDSFKYKLLNFGQKILDALRNLEQYLIYKRKDDDIADDKIRKPLAGHIGTVGAFIETKINPIAEPLSVLAGERVEGSYNSIAHSFSSLYWRARLLLEKTNWKSFKLLLNKIKKLFCDKNINEKDQARAEIKDIISLILGAAGAVCIVLFSPLKAWNKLRGHESKLVNWGFTLPPALQNGYYFLRFTLASFFEYQKRKTKNDLILFLAGVASNFTNCTLPLIDLLPVNDSVKSLWKEAAQGLLRTFFSIRRNILGNEWLEKYPEDRNESS